MSNITKYEIIKIIQETNTFEDFINLDIFYDENNSKKGFAFELICEFAFLFGQTHINKNDYVMLFGKNKSLKKITEIDVSKYLREKYISGNTEGIADIKYLDIQTDKIVAISVKKFMKKKVQKINMIFLH